MRRLASRTMRELRFGRLAGLARGLDGLDGHRGATSPAFAPPMPSATANNGGCTTSESSFAVRWRPTSVRPACSTIRSATSRYSS